MIFNLICLFSKSHPLKIGEFSLGTLSDPEVELADMEPEQFEKGVNEWLNYFKKTGKLELTKGFSGDLLLGDNPEFSFWIFK